MHHVNQNPQDATYRIAARLGLAPRAVLSALKGIELADIPENHRWLGGRSPTLLKSAHRLIPVLIKGGVLAHEPPLAPLFVARFLPDA